MKLAPLLLAGSLVANGALVAVYLTRIPSPAAIESTRASSAASPTALKSPGVTLPVTTDAELAANTADPKTWANLNPNDLRGLVARLRTAGFPPATIRAIIAAQVQAQLRDKAKEIAESVPLKPFWATQRGFVGNYDPKVNAAMRDLYRESTRLIKEALGPDFPADDSEISDGQRRRYGNLPKEKIDQLERVSGDYNELRMQTNMATGGLVLPEDREKLALLAKEEREDLARLLTPQDLADYQMRTSQVTSQLRTSMTLMGATDAEFQAIYKAKQAFEDKYGYQAMGFSMDQETIKARTAAQQAMADQLKATLGDARYADYTRSADREYQSLTRLAEQANLPTTAANQAYDLRSNASKESNRIYADSSLSNDQKRDALKTLAQNTRTQLSTTLGADAGSSYMKVADRWLSNIERGGAVTFTETGGTSTRSLPPARAAGSGAAPAASIKPGT